MRVVYRRSRDEPVLRHAVRPTATLRDHPARPRPNAYLVPLPRKIRGGAPSYPDASGTATGGRGLRPTMATLMSSAATTAASPRP
jgi:hypothetical protein